MSKINYGEILFVGKCNFNCFYCLGHEMHPSVIEDTFNVHFSKWRYFEKWLNYLHNNNVKTMYLSSTNSEPLLYKYIDELIDYLQNDGFDVGIRTNGSLNVECCNKCKEEISLSLQSLNIDTFYKITGVPLKFDFLENLSKIQSNNIRVSIVVNRYNYLEVEDMLNILKNYNLQYVQLRKCYKYYDEDIAPDIKAFEYVKEKLKAYKVKGNFHESIIYDVNNLPVSVWETVFEKSSISSSNYWTNGIITDNNLLVEGYNDEYYRVLSK